MSMPLAKYERIRESLSLAIRQGEYRPGARLPGERVLAVRFGVSYMTARRAVQELVDARLLEKRARSGVFVVGSTAVAVTTVSVITLGREPSHVVTLKRLVAKHADARGWDVRYVRADRDTEDDVVRCILRGGLSLLIAPDDQTLRGPVGEAVQQVGGRAVLIGSRMDHCGVPSVLADDTEAIGIAVNRLREAGHRNIGLLCDYPSHPVTVLQIAKWRSCFAREVPSEILDRRLIAVQTPRFESPTGHAYQKMGEYLARPDSDVTALVCTGDEIALAALSACQDAGRPCPQAMSVVVSGNSELAAHTNPPLTCVDLDLELHAVLALEFLDRVRAGTLPETDRLKLIAPRLIERASVASHEN